MRTTRIAAVAAAGALVLAACTSADAEEGTAPEPETAQEQAEQAEDEAEVDPEPQDEEPEEVEEEVEPITEIGERVTSDQVEASIEAGASVLAIRDGDGVVVDPDSGELPDAVAEDLKAWSAQLSEGIETNDVGTYMEAEGTIADYREAFAEVGIVVLVLRENGALSEDAQDVEAMEFRWGIEVLGDESPMNFVGYEPEETIEVFGEMYEEYADVPLIDPR